VIKTDKLKKNFFLYIFFDSLDKIDKQALELGPSKQFYIKQIFKNPKFLKRNTHISC